MMGAMTTVGQPSMSATTARGRMPRRLTQLALGLALYGCSTALLVRSELGLPPWPVLHQGLAKMLGVTIGTTTICLGLLLLLSWIPLRERPGLGTVGNVLLIGVALDAALRVVPEVDALAVRITFAVAGIVLTGVATAAYIGVRLGPGPRDGLMTALVRRSTHSIRLVRTSIEAVVLVVGILLGGTIGVVTVAYVVAIGPLTQFFARYLVIHLPSDATLSGRLATIPPPR
jgi:uncharacterized membrane protein YczE